MAIGVDRSAGYAFAGVVGTLNGTSGAQVGASLKFYKIQVQNNSNSNINLQAEDDAASELFELIVRQFPNGILAYHAPADTTGIIYLICDGVNAPEASVIQSAIRALGATVGANSVDVRGTDVTDGTSFTVV